MQENPISESTIKVEEGRYSKLDSSVEPDRKIAMRILFRIVCAGKKKEMINKPKGLNFLDKNLCNFLIFIGYVARPTSLSPTLFKKAT